MQNIVENFKYVLAADIINQNPDHANIDGISDKLISANRKISTTTAGKIKMIDIFNLIKKVPSSVLGNSSLIVNINVLLDLWSQESTLETYKNFELFENGNLKTVLNNISITGVDNDVLPAEINGTSQTGKVVAILGNFKKAYKLYRSTTGNFVLNHQFEQACKDQVETIYEEVIGGGLVEPEQLYALTLA